MFDEDREKRRRVRFEELPDHLVKAVLAIEDRRFYSHPGLDPIALARPGPAQPPLGQRDPLRRQHDHAAALQELLPDPGRRARLPDGRAELPEEGAGGAARLRARAAGHQAGDPRALPQRDLPRPGGLVRHQRGRRGGADLLPQGRGEPDPARVGAPRRDDPVAEPLQPVPPREARDRAAERGHPGHAGRGLHRRRDDGGGAARRPSSSSSPASTPRTPPTSSTSCASSSASATTRRTSRPRTSRSTRRSTCTCRASPSRRSSAGSSGSRS